MKAYRWFIVVAVLLLAVLIVLQLNQPRKLTWDLTVSKDDKNPYGGYILYKQLGDLFPSAPIYPYRLPPYDQVNNSEDSNTAYLLIGESVNFSSQDLTELLNYVDIGNTVFISTEYFDKGLLDTLKVKDTTSIQPLSRDSTVNVNFTNPLLKTKEGYTIARAYSRHYFSRWDSSAHIALGTADDKEINFLKVPHGKGHVYLHTEPACFTNYFMLNKNNHRYTAEALSYLREDLFLIYWDEYYKLGPERSGGYFKEITKNEFLRWALWIAIVAGLFYILFELKRRQRIIPVIVPLKNTTLDFVKTVGSVYFNRKDNKNIAAKKISYFLEYVRSHLFIQTTQLDEEFRNSLASKTGASAYDVDELVNLIRSVNESGYVSDEVLLLLNNKIDEFYQLAK